MSLRATSATASSGPQVLTGTNADGTPVTWMESNWAFLSWAIFLFGAGVLVARWKDVRSGNPRQRQRWYGWLALVAYCLHQSEEHAYDLRGWRYSFVPAFNVGPLAPLYDELCRDYLDVDTGDATVSCPLDPKITLYVNTILIWIGFGGCMVAAELAPARFLFSGSLNWGTAVVNGLGGHILPAVLARAYNPGAVQSAAMVPLGLSLVWKSGRPILCLANGVLVHVILVAGINVVFRFHTDEALTMSILMLAAALVVPLGISRAVSSKNSNKNYYKKK